MTNWGFEEDNENNGLGNDTELSGPKALRDAYANLKKQNDELNARLTSFLDAQEKQKVASVFENLGIPGAASVYQGPADPKAAEEWAKSMQQVFGGNQGGTPPVADQAPQQDQGNIPPAMQDRLQQFNEAGQGGIPAGNFEAAQSAVGNASSNEDLIAAFQRMQRM